MNRKGQLVLSAAVVAVAGLVVATVAVTDDGGGGDAGSGSEHANHGAVAVSGEIQPVSLDAEQARRIGVTYATATIRTLTRELTTVGNVVYDETRLANVNPKIEGWVEELYVDFTGAPVRRGEPLVAVYSPMLVSAQEELLLARRLADQASAGGGERARSNAEDLLQSARRRMRYWDISDDQIRRIEESGTTQRTVVLHSPVSGIVVEKMVVQGARIMPGMDIYRIADLSRVWVEGDVFEKDLSLVRLNQDARISFEAYPGEVFAGRVTYVYPSVDTESRTGRIRIELDNPGLRIRPGMYARIELESRGARPALLIPRSAVHYTGDRAMVFVRDASGVLRSRDVTVGLVAGNDIEVLAGLTEGEVVVTSANFLIDAEANMGASAGAMDGMNTGPGGEPAPASQDHTGH